MPCEPRSLLDSAITDRIDRKTRNTTQPAVAQKAEQPDFNPEGSGSIPDSGSNKEKRDELNVEHHRQS